VKYLILGAGPSGLTFARQLQLLGEESFLVVEKESEVGGLCRSRKVGEVWVDIGGGHFLDARNTEACDFLFAHLGREEWLRFERVSKIELASGVVDYPIEANLWQLPLESQILYLESAAKAGCVRGEPEPEGFSEWIRWKLGERIAEEYMLPYNKKLWSWELDDLGTYWMAKLPDVSFREMLRSCLERRATGAIPAHATFYYPRSGGYAAVWERIADHFRDRIVTKTPIETIERRIVNGHFRGERVISTVPWSDWPHWTALPAEVAQACRSLKAAGTAIDYWPSPYPTRAHWVYCPDEALAHHRVLEPDTFGAVEPGHWTETNALRLRKLSPHLHHLNSFAYPIPTRAKPASISIIKKWAQRHGILPLGRWGEWEHYNSDVCVSRAMALAHELVRGQ